MQIRRTVSIPAGSTVQNILAGLSPEFASEDSQLTLAMTCIAAGATFITATLRLTDEVVMDQALIGIENAANRGPILPDDILLARQPVARGDHLILSVSNTDVAARTVTYILSLDPI